jgi:hypothetical protein
MNTAPAEYILLRTFRDLFQGQKYKHRDPYPFDWVDYEKTRMEYSALLVRVSREYDRRFV